MVASRQTSHVPWSGQLQLQSARADMSLAALTALGVSFTRNWRGQVAADLSTLVLEGDWPVAAVGTIDVRDLTAPCRAARASAATG